MNKIVISVGCLFFCRLAIAAPFDGQVAAGVASISQTGNSTVITQTSPSAVINWQGFNTVSGESVQFNQPSNTAVAVNRITSGLPTNFNGSLSANGHVWILNPAGVVFAQSSSVNVAGLLATTMDIKDEDVMQGKYNFYSVPGYENASVINNGFIDVREAGEMGVVALVAPNVINGPNGIIRAKAGKIALASGTAFVLDFNGDELINFATTVANTPPAKNGQVINQGKIYGEAGSTVWMTANAVSDTLNNVIDMSGVIEAKSVENKSGRIILNGGDAGVVKISGQLSSDNNGYIITKGQKIDYTGGEFGPGISPGVGGVWIYSTPDIMVDANLAGQIILELNSGASVMLQSQNDININNIMAQTDSHGPVLLGLDAGHDININKAVLLYTDGSLWANAGNNININQSGISTGGDQIYNSAVKLNGQIRLAAQGNIIFRQAVDGLADLILTSPGEGKKIEFDGEVGSQTVLNILRIIGDADIKTDKIITQTSQNYYGKVVLDNPNKINFESQEVRFFDAVNYLNVAADVIINGNLVLFEKGHMDLNSLTVTGDVAGGNVVTQDFQDYQGNYYLDSDVNLSSVNGKIKFRNKIDSLDGGLFNLTVLAPEVELNGAVGGYNKLNNINIAAQNINISGSEINTVGSQNYNGNINLLNNLSVKTDQKGSINFDVINGLDKNLRLVSGKGIDGSVHVKKLSLGGTGGSRLINSSVNGHVCAETWNFIDVDRTATGDYWFNGIHDWPEGITPEMDNVIVDSEIFVKPQDNMMNLDLGETDLDPIDSNPSPETVSSDQSVDVNLYTYETCQGRECGEIDVFYKKHPHKIS